MATWWALSSCKCYSPSYLPSHLQNLVSICRLDISIYMSSLHLKLCIWDQIRHIPLPALSTGLSHWSMAPPSIQCTKQKPGVFLQTLHLFPTFNCWPGFASSSSRTQSLLSIHSPFSAQFSLFLTLINAMVFPQHSHQAFSLGGFTCLLAPLSLAQCPMFTLHLVHISITTLIVCTLIGCFL